jgi:hypothetical protein
MVQLKSIAVSSLAATVLVACGGGGGGGSPTDGGSPTSLTITGVAATGAAISGGPVSAKCSSGTGDATTNTDGTYSLAVTSGVQPCVLKAIDPVSNASFFSVLEAGQTVANVTPLTTLVAANVLEDDPAVIYNTSSASGFSKITTSRLASAKEVLVEVSKTFGSEADLTGFDPLKDELIAKTSDVDGNDLDKKIDILMATLEANNKAISDLVTLLKTSSDKGVISDEVSNVVLKESNPTLKFRTLWNSFILDIETSFSYTGNLVLTATGLQDSVSTELALGFEKEANKTIPFSVFNDPCSSFACSEKYRALTRLDITATSETSSEIESWYYDTEGLLMGVVDSDGLVLVPSVSKQMPENISVGMTGTYFRGDFESEYGRKCGTGVTTWTVKPGSSSSLLFLLRIGYEQTSQDYSVMSTCGEPYSSQTTYVFEVTDSDIQLINLESNYLDSEAQIEGLFEVLYGSSSLIVAAASDDNEDESVVAVASDDNDDSNELRYGRAFIYD